MAEKRRRAPGWLDSEVRVLEPERKIEAGDEGGKGKGREVNLMDHDDEQTEVRGERKQGDELGDAMDRVFGRGLGG